MAKQFFKEFMMVAEILEQDKRGNFGVYTADNYSCFEAVKKYLYSYKWVRSEREKVLLQTAGSYKKGEDIADENGIQYNSYRSMSSRVSRRLYEELGQDLKKVILGNDKKQQDKLIHYCIMRVDDFQLLNHYPMPVISEIENIIRGRDGKAEEDFKIVKSDWVILKFLAEYDMETIMKVISMLDTERLAVFYTILTDKRYFKERAEVLSVIKYFKDKISVSSIQAETDLLSKERVMISKKEYQEYLKCKKEKGEIHK